MFEAVKIKVVICFIYGFDQSDSKLFEQNICCTALFIFFENWTQCTSQLNIQTFTISSYFVVFKYTILVSFAVWSL